MNDNTPNMMNVNFDDPADAALDAQLAVLARMDGLAMPDGLEAALVSASAAAAARQAATPVMRLTDGVREHAGAARAVRTQRWRLTAMKLAAGLLLVAGLAMLAQREGATKAGATSGTQVASTTTVKPGAKSTTSGGATTTSIADTSDWAIVTAVLGDTPASDMRDLWSDTASLDERIKSGPSSSDLLTSEGSL